MATRKTTTASRKSAKAAPKAPRVAPKAPRIYDTREAANRRLTRKDVQKAAERCRNWGRWGPDDEIGTLNFTTAEDIVAAAQLVKKAR